MAKKKIANLDSATLNEMGDAMVVQGAQLRAAEEMSFAMEDGVDMLESINAETAVLGSEAEQLVEQFLLALESDGCVEELEGILQPTETDQNTANNFVIPKVNSVEASNDWEVYKRSFQAYAEEYAVDLSKDPFSTLLSQQEYIELQKEINDDFAEKTSIRNKLDMRFLAIATALQVTKALLFPLVADKVGYGEKFDKTTRLAENDKSILLEEKKTRDAYKNKKLEQGHQAGEWTEMLYRTPPYDITRGSPAIGVNMEGRYHRIHTLGHDPVLGWLFGTSNILTDVVTLDTFVSYKVARNPMIITPERVPFVSLFGMTISKIKEDPLNLPAALVAQGVHLKSDAYTKCGLPVPILETFSPDFAGKLYKNQYDALCFSRDLKVVGTSAVISVLIDMIIGLTHALFYNKDQDGTKHMFEVRTRKILLISNTIATSSNIIYAAVTENPKALDIGGLLVTIMHLFSDTRFMLNVKKEFIEDRLYEKIEDEIKAIEQNQDKLSDFEYRNMINT